MLVALMLVVAGCTSIYHRTRSEMPPDPAAEVELRLAEARHAEAQASQAGKKLLANLRKGKVDTLISADFDRLEAAGFELERRALAVRDASARNGDGAKVTAEIERLLRSAQSWLAYVQVNRSTERKIQTGHLEALLANPAEGGRQMR